MDQCNISIATVTLIRNTQERDLLHQSMQRLSALGVPVAVADADSGKDFTDYLENLPNLKVYKLERSGLFLQAKESLVAASHLGKRYVLYTESDKLWFFENELGNFISQALDDDNTGIFLASRDARSFSTFPEFQRHTEAVINQLVEKLVGQGGDYVYGPMLIRRTLIDSLSLVQEDIGWGFRFFLIGIAHRLGQHLVPLTLTLPNPAYSHQEETLDVRLYRVQQLVQNSRGLVHSFEVPLSSPLHHK